MKRFGWGFYGLLLGPIELVIMRLFNGNLSLIQTILVMAITSFAFMFIPMIIKLIMRLCKKDFFTKEGLFIAGGTASISVALSWLIVLIIDAKDDGIFSIILSVCLLECLFIVIHSAILFGFYRIVYGDDESHLAQLRYNNHKRK